MYRLRQLDVDDKVCEQISPGVLEKIYPTEVIEQYAQGSDQWTGTRRRVRQSTALALVPFVMMLALWSRLNQRQVWQKLVGGQSRAPSREPGVWVVSLLTAGGRIRKKSVAERSPF